ncbi:MAG: phage tail protein [Anaerolineaceae bacterium]|nr:phage tail protein [Anaerolineaceae bacterium]
MAGHEDPLVGFHFGVDIQGKVTGYFTECSGLGSEHEKIEHKVVTEKGQEMVLIIPGRLKWNDLVLKRGITSSLDIWKWRKEVENGGVEGARKDGSIVMFNWEGKEVARWSFKRAWPLKVSGPSVKSDGNEIAIEELTIVYEYFEREQ